MSKETVQTWPQVSADFGDRTSQALSLQTTLLEGYGYQLLRTLGEGTYGVVKLAHSAQHRSNVAVKIVSKTNASADYMRKFLPREIAIIKTLKHPYIVVFLEVITALL